MNNLCVEDNIFVDNHPTTEGLYLWKNSLGVELIKVVVIPAKQEYGISWESYLGVVSMRGRSVNKLVGSFVKLTVGE